MIDELARRLADEFFEEDMKVPACQRKPMLAAMAKACMEVVTHELREGTIGAALDCVEAGRYKAAAAVLRGALPDA